MPWSDTPGEELMNGWTSLHHDPKTIGVLRDASYSVRTEAQDAFLAVYVTYNGERRFTVCTLYDRGVFLGEGAGRTQEDAYNDVARRLERMGRSTRFRRGEEGWSPVDVE